MARPEMTRTFFTSGVGGPAEGFPAGGLKLMEGFALIFLGEVGGDAAGFASSMGMSAAAAGSASFSPFAATSASAGFSSVTLSAGPPSEAASTTSEASCSPSVSRWVASTAPDPSDSTSSSWGWGSCTGTS